MAVDTEGQKNSRTLNRGTVAQRNSVTEKQWHRGTMGAEEQWAQRNNGCRGTVRKEEQRAQGNSGHRGTVGTEEQWAQRRSGTEEQAMQSMC